MAFKMKLGPFVIIKTDKDAKEPANAFEIRVEAVAEVVESGLLRWIRNDRFFDGLRNTYARVVLHVLTVATVFGLGLHAFLNPGQTGFYLLAILIIALMQKLSTRFVFDLSDELLDEYQLARRDSAFRKAYVGLGKLTFGLIVGLIVAFYLLIEDNQNLHLEKLFTLGDQQLDLTLPLTLNQIAVISIFLASVFNMQKYLAWGTKGEPLRSKHEANE